MGSGGVILAMEAQLIGDAGAIEPETSDPTPQPCAGDTPFPEVSSQGLCLFPGGSLPCMHSLSSLP